jgi:hypothetical protein
VIVRERPGRVHFLWGFLSVVFAAALVRGHLGMSGAGRVAVDAVFAVLVAGSLGAWVWSRRHPAHLEIGPDAIVLVHRGRPRTTTLPRTSGELYVRTTLVGGKHPVHFLKTPGCDAAIDLQMFDRRELEDACSAAGWRFVPPPR